MNKEPGMDRTPQSSPGASVSPGTLALAAGAALGAAFAYFLDPVSGRRRRARFSGKIFHVLREAAHSIERVSADFSGRGHGMFSRLGNFIMYRPVDDDILTERVRSKVGHYVTHPRAVEVETRNGVVTLRGAVPAAESGRLVYHARWIPGVKAVQNLFTDPDGPGGHDGHNGHKAPAPGA
ncbi:MAG: cyclase/dehydrase [Fibrobacteres bacterium]|nr:cyclase/dehydrase [Fibrobacterota bacterium]